MHTRSGVILKDYKEYVEVDLSSVEIKDKYLPALPDTSRIKYLIKKNYCSPIKEITLI